MIVKKCSEIADAAGAPTYVRARPTSRPMFESEGFRVLKEIPITYGKGGGGLGTVCNEEGSWWKVKIEEWLFIALSMQVGCLELRFLGWDS